MHLIQIAILLIYVSFPLFINSTSCTYNPLNCSDLCYYSSCYYDPAVPNSGNKCCYGCKYETYYFNKSTGQCKIPQPCGFDSNGNQLYYYRDNNTCLSSCPLTWYSNTSVILYLFANPEVKSCVSYCPASYSQDYFTRTCRKKCSIGYYVPHTRYNYTQCYPSCYMDQNKMYGDDELGMCVKLYQCSYSSSYKTQTYADNFTRKCLPQCIQGSFAHPEIRVCVQQCFGNYSFPNSYKWVCVKTQQQQTTFQAQVYQAMSPYLSSYGNVTEAQLAETQSSVDKIEKQLFIISIIFALCVVILIILFITYACYVKNKIWKLKYSQSIPLQTTSKPTFDQI